MYGGKRSSKVLEEARLLGEGQGHGLNRGALIRERRRARAGAHVRDRKTARLCLRLHLHLRWSLCLCRTIGRESARLRQSRPHARDRSNAVACVWRAALVCGGAVVVGSCGAGDSSDDVGTRAVRIRNRALLHLRSTDTCVH